MSLIIETAVITDRGLNPRYTVNEDSHLIMEAEQVFAVADGVGGAFAGEVASRTALKIIQQGIKKYSRQLKNNHIDIMQKLIVAGNEAVYKTGLDKAKLLASTIAIISFADTYAILGHVGDSRIYLARDNRLLQLTRDHSKLQELLEQNPKLSLTRAEYREGHVITRALGVEEDVEPEIQKVNIKHGDMFILCTDGIYIHNSDREMLENLQTHQSDLKKACEALKKNCYDRGAKDNLTAIVLKII